MIVDDGLIRRLVADLRGRGLEIAHTVDDRHPSGRRWSPGERRSQLLEISGPGGQSEMATAALLLQAFVPDAEVLTTGRRPELGIGRFRFWVRVWPGTIGGGQRSSTIAKA